MSEFSKQDLGVGSLKLEEEPAALPKVCGIYLNRLKRKKRKRIEVDWKLHSMEPYLDIFSPLIVANHSKTKSL